MPIFGADHTEPEGSNFARQEEDFGTLRKAVKEIDSELKKNFKYYKGIAKPLEDICLAVNHFYDGPHTTTEYRTRGSRLTNMVARIAVGVETYDSEYGSLMQMVASYGDKLKTAKGLMDDRLDKLAEYNAKKKSFNSMQSKEGKDPAKVKVAQDKFQAAKDAFEAADAKLSKSLTEISEDACAEFEECYIKFIKVQASLFATAAAALGGADLPTSTTQFNVTGSDEAPLRVYKDTQKEEKKREKKEKKEEKKKNKKSKTGSGSVDTTPSGTARMTRNDVFEPSEERGDDYDDDTDVPPPSLSTPPFEHHHREKAGIGHNGRASISMPSGGAPPPLPAGRPSSNPSSSGPSSPSSTSTATYELPSMSPHVLPSNPPPLPPGGARDRSSTSIPVTTTSSFSPNPPARVPTSELLTGLDLIGREPSSGAPPALPPHSSGPPTLPPGRPSPSSNTDSTSPRQPNGPPPSLPPSANTPPNARHTIAFPTDSGSAAPPLPGRAPSGSISTPSNSRHSMAGFSSESSGPPALPPGRAPSASVSSVSRPPALTPSVPSSQPPVLPSSRTSASNGEGPPLPTGRYSVAPDTLQPVQPMQPLQPMPTQTPKPSMVATPLAAGAPPALPSGRVSAAPGPPSLPSRSVPSAPSVPSYSSAPADDEDSFNPRASSSLGGFPSSSAPSSSSTSFHGFKEDFGPPKSQIAIPLDEINKYSLIFKREDPQQSGFITGQQALTLFTRSKLPSTELAQIWELSDQDKDGRLTKDEFVIAMWYINSRLKQIIDSVPKEVHPSLILSKYPDRKLPV